MVLFSIFFQSNSRFTYSVISFTGSYLYDHNTFISLENFSVPRSVVQSIDGCFSFCSSHFAIEIEYVPYLVVVGLYVELQRHQAPGPKPFSLPGPPFCFL